MKKHIEAFDYAAQILKGVKHGALITAKADGRVNPMTIGWGSLGTEWNTPVFIAYVRESRFTRELLDKNPEFTVNIPLEGCDKKILQLCGTQSGRDVDKVAALNLTLEDGETVSVPGIKELPLTLECKVVYRRLQEARTIAEPHFSRHYPEPVDAHYVYYGEITAAYILE